VPTSNQKKRKWTALICPVCRFVFRVPKNHPGKGVICPACHYMLRLPKEGDTKDVPKLAKREKPREKSIERSINKAQPLKPKEKVKKGGDVKSPTVKPVSEKTALSLAPVNVEKERKRVRRRKGQHTWEEGKGGSESNALGLIIGGSVLGLLVVGVSAWLLMGDGTNKEPADVSVHKESKEILVPHRVKEDQMTAEEKQKQEEISKTVETGMSVLEEATPVVEDFLNAETSEEVLGTLNELQCMAAFELKTHQSFRLCC